MKYIAKCNKWHTVIYCKWLHQFITGSEGLQLANFFATKWWNFWIQKFNSLYDSSYKCAKECSFQKVRDNAEHTSTALSFLNLPCPHSWWTFHLHTIFDVRYINLLWQKLCYNYYHSMWACVHVYINFQNQVITSVITLTWQEPTINMFTDF